MHRVPKMVNSLALVGPLSAAIVSVPAAGSAVAAPDTTHHLDQATTGSPATGSFLDALPAIPGLGSALTQLSPAAAPQPATEKLATRSVAVPTAPAETEAIVPPATNPLGGVLSGVTSKLSGLTAGLTKPVAGAPLDSLSSPADAGGASSGVPAALTDAPSLPTVSPTAALGTVTTKLGGLLSGLKPVTAPVTRIAPLAETPVNVASANPYVVSKTGSGLQRVECDEYSNVLGGGGSSFLLQTTRPAVDEYGYVVGWEAKGVVGPTTAYALCNQVAD